MAKEKICGVYKIENLINGKVYIGSSIDIYKRWKYHISDFKANRHCNKYFQSAWNKYGKNNFEFSIVEKIDDENILFEREQYWLDLLNPFGENGYNLCKTTNSYSFGYKLSDESKEKIKNRIFSEKHRQRMSDNSPNKIKIVQLSLDGELIKIWDSLTEACENLNANKTTVSACLRKIGKRLSAKNFIWMYYEEFIQNNSKEIIENIVYKIKNKKQNGKRPIVQMTLNDNFICYWDNATEAGRVLNIDRVGIMNCCRGRQGEAFGFKWVYEDDYNNNKLTKFTYKGRQHKNVVQLDMKYNLINVWESVEEINNQLNIEISSIYRCCNQKLNSFKGYRWLYKEDYKTDNYVKSKLNGQAKPIIQLSLDEIFIKEWDNAKFIKEELNLNPSTIKSVCNGENKTNIHKGFRWIYKKDYKELIS